jgi:hypothetical protein
MLTLTGSQSREWRVLPPKLHAATLVGAAQKIGEGRLSSAARQLTSAHIDLITVVLPVPALPST